MRVGEFEVKGLDVDAKTRCKHYHCEVDIIAIKFPCCETYYPCHLCHEAVAGHSPSVWSQAQFDESAVLCGACGHEFSIRQYLECNNTCPNCSAQFNPGCSIHYELYFDVEGFEFSKEKKGSLA